MQKVVWTLFFLACLIGLGWWMIPISEADRSLYTKLLESSNQDKTYPDLTYTQQKRKNVCKQIWYQDKSPLHFRIDSEESELFFIRQKGQLEVVEQLENVTCMMQEELYYDGKKPMQKVRYLEAKCASYNYNTQLFVAENVILWKYQVDGHAPPTQLPTSTPLMKAKAHSVEFTLKGEKLNFTAHRMKATFNEREPAL